MKSVRIAIGEHQLATPSADAGDFAESRQVGLAGQIHRHPEPGKECGRLGFEPGRKKNVAETLGGEVGGDEAQVFGRRRCRGGEAIAFVILRRRVVDLVNDEVFAVRLLPQSEGIEARADDHILPNALFSRA